MPVTVGELVVEPAAEPQRGGEDAAADRRANDTLSLGLAEQIELALHVKAERRERLRAD